MTMTDNHQHSHVDHAGSQHDRRFQGQADRLRAPDRLARMEVPRVAALSTEGITVESVLDIGTGTGVFAEAFAAQGIAVTGIDVNAELLEVARQAVPTAQFRQAPVEQIPFADRSFDLAFLGHVLHEADDPLTALEEARRVARTRVAILEWPYRQDEKGPPLEHRLKPEFVTALAQQAGFQRVETLHLEYMDFYRLTP
jgi:ubiquinone/menaquinone biosynthesis C-methylase UbiE